MLLVLVTTTFVQGTKRQGSSFWDAVIDAVERV